MLHSTFTEFCGLPRLLTAYYSDTLDFIAKVKHSDGTLTDGEDALIASNKNMSIPGEFQLTQTQGLNFNVIEV